MSGSSGIVGDSFPADDRIRKIVDLLATWGAAERPSTADILEAIDGFGGSSLIRLLHQQCRDMLSEDLYASIEKAVATRGQVAGLQERAEAELGLEIQRKREALSPELGAWLAALEWSESGRLLEAFWSTERTPGLESKIAAVRALLELEEQLEAARSRVMEHLAGPADDDETVSRARAALTGGNPDEVPRALRVLEERRRQRTDRSREEEAREARERVRALSEEALNRAGNADGAIDGLSAAILARAAEAAERATGETLHDWEATLGTLLGGEVASPAGDRQARLAFSETLRDELARRVRAEPAPVAGEAESIATALVAAAKDGGAGFNQTVHAAMVLIRRIDGDARTRAARAAASVRETYRTLEKFLEKNADRCPTARIIDARLRLDQVEAMIAVGDVPGIVALHEAISVDLADLRKIVDEAESRRRDHQESERDVLLREAARLARAAGGKDKQRLDGLAAKLQDASGEEIAFLGAQIERAGRALEGSLRLQAGKIHRSAQRWLGPDGSPRRRKNADLAESAEALGASMAGDDLVELGAKAAEARTRLRKASPLARPAVRVALGLIVLILVAGGAFLPKLLDSGLEDYQVSLDDPGGRAVEVMLVREGRVVARQQHGGDAGGVVFHVPDGRYEVYVDGRYTGTVLSPGQRTQSGIKVPAGPE